MVNLIVNEIHDVRMNNPLIPAKSLVRFQEALRRNLRPKRIDLFSCFIPLPEKFCTGAELPVFLPKRLPSASDCSANSRCADVEHFHDQLCERAHTAKGIGEKRVFGKPFDHPASQPAMSLPMF